ncbi:MAG: hypothetical protein EOP43_06055 [Sphingobacteriaceae bacterium]|nr:MAG: hypothetical protein EOP43_06055 [Sphingobacteriaceae bacterium]
MRNTLLTVISLFILEISFAQGKQVIETKDIDNFWSAFDSLKYATSVNDSINIIQARYIDQASNYFKEFIKLRKFTAEEYITLIKKYPKFWSSIRKETENVKFRKAEIEKVLDVYEKALPEFKRPNVCFAIGCLRTGGTTRDNLIVIGTELAASTTETNKSELSPWLKSIIGTLGDIFSMVAHEAIHIQQKDGLLKNLVEFSMNEGVADFLSEKITGYNINKITYKYGFENDCTLRIEFLNDFSKNKINFSGWLFNGGKSVNRPANLGYYIGYRVAEEYYFNATDKKEAVSALLNTKNYMKIFKQSKYINKGCS